ncbi:MAG: sugar phosphate isomerase/epimerase [Candidatus Omnitrophica bacterium]|nr:sugar phosphate isomerase/epimerase [Candidatus Omnitrophota bacterium]
MFAVSTSWNAWRHSQGQDIVNEIKELGFNQVELNFNLNSTIVEQIHSLTKQGLVDVVSVHNFCPIPKGFTRKQASPDMLSLAASDEQERNQAVNYTKMSVDTASKLGARVLVLHLGRVEVEEKIRTLASCINSHALQDCDSLKLKMQKERKLKAGRFFAQALKSLEQLCPYAQRRKVKLGIENRYYFSEIPSIEEMEIILKTFPEPALYYWHDVGHAQVYENLGFLKHKTILDRFSQRMIGIHLHDIEGIDDHRAPLKGKFDFRLLKKYVNENMLLVLETHHPAKAQDIIRGKEYLEKLFA